ncbi:DUF7638 domain-containing protein [Gimesia aquarii]|uniref:Uncharacterized protein n=1 Tax=Gimesia aquarii TaxID=2527964 RepID=A0A517VTZ9_9PLAN|nr:hypothetical protein [Gimesia aquarii]QDT96481.1 hypothetical protein V144x_19380 [Gimesia aquarii]
MTTSSIIRTRPKPLGQSPGIAIPGFIHNGTYFFTELDVFADGLFECWGGVDLDFLTRNLESGWISPMIPNGANFNIHELISGKVVSGKWTHNQDSLHERLLNCLQVLNPEMKDLFDFKGEDVELRDGARYSKVGLIDVTPCQKVCVENSPVGKSRYAFVCQNGQEYLVPLRIYADGGIDVHPLLGEEKLIDFNELEYMIKTKDLSMTVPDHTVIEIDTFGRFEIDDINFGINNPVEFLTEVQDIILELNGKPDSVTRCREVFQQYLEDPTVLNQKLLKEAYEAIPQHNRMYVGDMDTKDIPVRIAIYGENEIENWSHRIVARLESDSNLPTINIPKPKDKGGE